jgi:tetratricopeptide (TPR) repeat protein
MKPLTALYAALALALCLWLGFQWKQAIDAEPRTLLDEARRSMSGPDLDYRAALLGLGLALEAAEKEQDLALIEEVLTTRAELLRRTGGYLQARADLERVLTHLRPGSLSVEAQLAAIDLDAGAVEAALQRASAVLGKDRTQADAWGVRALALLRLAEARLEAARERAGMSSKASGDQPTDALLRRIAVLAPNDPARARRAEEFLALFPSAERDAARDALEELDDASALFAQVPEAIAESLRGSVRRDAMEAYVRLLADAGRKDLAADLGLCLVRTPWLSSYWPFQRDLMRALVDAGRAEAAMEVVPPDLGRRTAPDATFFGTWADAMYNAGRWRELVPISNHLRQWGEPDQRVSAWLYLGLAHAKLGNRDEALDALKRYVTRPPVEPFPGALALAWRTLAELYGSAADETAELAALRKSIAASNDLTAGVGDAWARLSELSWRQPGESRVLSVDDAAHALRLAPARRAQLEALWREHGELVASNSRFDIAAEARSLVERGLTIPEGRRTSYELVRMAELCLESEAPGVALALARRVLTSFPGLMPALEVAADAYARSGAPLEAVDALRELLERSGPDEAVLARILELGEDALDGDRRADLVRLDPEGLGRRWAAEDLRDRGEVGEAVAGLQRVAPARLGDEGNLLLAQMLYDQGQYERAQTQLSRLSADADLLARALPLALHIGIAKRDDAHVSNLMRLLDAKVKVDGDALLDCVDHMLSLGNVAGARELVTRMQERGKLRTGALFVREAQVAMLLGELDTAAEALERALAYDESGAPELGLLLLHVERREWSALPRAVVELSQSGFSPTSMQYCAAAALGERVAEARAAATAADVLEDERMLWELLGAALSALGSESSLASESVAQLVRTEGFGVSAAGTIERDPRRLLSRLLALGHPSWTSWAIADLSRGTPPQPGTVWPSYLATQGLAWLGDTRTAESRARAIVEGWPSFAGGWDLLESVLQRELRRPDHPRLLRLVEERRAALGEPSRPTADLAIAEARLAEQRGDLDAALAAAESAVQLDPESAPAQRRLAQVLRKRGEWAAALAAFHAGMERARGGESDNVPVKEFLALCEEARVASAGALDRAVKLEVDFLAARFPTDPLTTLAQARAALREAADDPRGARARVDSLLADLRRRAEGTPLEHLRAGSAIEWAEFYAQLDPEGACELLEEELRFTPASVELWRALAQACERVGWLDRAAQAAETAVRMLPDAASARMLAVLSARRGDSLDTVQRHVDDARRVSGAAAEDRALTLAVARALMQGNSAKLAEAITLLERLWKERSASARPAELGEIGTWLALALCRRYDIADRARAAAIIDEARRHVVDPTQRNVLVALSGVARFLGNQPSPQN